MARLRGRSTVRLGKNGDWRKICRWPMFYGDLLVRFNAEAVIAVAAAAGADGPKDFESTDYTDYTDFLRVSVG